MSSTIIGGGIGGLSTAYYLQKYSKNSIKLIEATSRLGGWIKTSVTDNGTIFEHGPRTIRPRGIQGQNTLELIDELQLANDIIPINSDHVAAKKRMIFVNNKLHLLPSSLSSVFQTTTPFSKPLISALWHDLRADSKQLKDESMYDFVERRLGKELADYAISPMICGICAGDAKEISVKFLMKNIFEVEQKYGGITKGIVKSIFKKSTEEVPRFSSSLLKKAKTEKWNVWTLKSGLESLTSGIHHNLRKGERTEILMESACSELKLSPDGAEYKVNGQVHRTDHVYCSLPSRDLASILDERHSELKQELRAIPFVTVGVVNLEYKGDVLKEDGFGFLIPPCENLPILGVIFDSCCLPQVGKTILTVMMGGRWFEEKFGTDPTEEYLLKIAVKHVNEILRIDQQPADHKVSILRQCIPQYILGHHDRVDRLRQYIAKHKLPITLVGSSYDGVGINDVILSARRGVHRITPNY